MKTAHAGTFVRRAVFAALVCLFASPACVFGAEEASADISLRLVLSPDELEGESYETLEAGSKKIYVWDRVYLSDADIDKIEVFKSSTSENILACFKFNDDGRRRLYRLAKRLENRYMAVFAGNRFVSVLPLSLPFFMGETVIVKWPGTESELHELIHALEKKRENVFGLYADETAAYNERAAVAWAEAYRLINYYFERRRAEAEAERLDVSEMIED